MKQDDKTKKQRLAVVILSSTSRSFGGSFDNAILEAGFIFERYANTEDLLLSHLQSVPRIVVLEVVNDQDWTQALQLAEKGNTTEVRSLVRYFLLFGSRALVSRDREINARRLGVDLATMPMRPKNFVFKLELQQRLFESSLPKRKKEFVAKFENLPNFKDRVLVLSGFGTQDGSWQPNSGTSSGKVRWLWVPTDKELEVEPREIQVWEVLSAVRPLPEHKRNVWLVDDAGSTLFESGKPKNDPLLDFVQGGAEVFSGESKSINTQVEFPADSISPRTASNKQAKALPVEDFIAEKSEEWQGIPHECGDKVGDKQLQKAEEEKAPLPFVKQTPQEESVKASPLSKNQENAKPLAEVATPSDFFLDLKRSFDRYFLEKAATEIEQNPAEEVPLIPELANQKPAQQESQVQATQKEKVFSPYLSASEVFAPKEVVEENADSQSAENSKAVAEKSGMEDRSGVKHSSSKLHSAPATKARYASEIRDLRENEFILKTKVVMPTDGKLDSTLQTMKEKRKTIPTLEESKFPLPLQEVVDFRSEPKSEVFDPEPLESTSEVFDPSAEAVEAGSTDEEPLPSEKSEKIEQEPFTQTQTAKTKKSPKEPSPVGERVEEKDFLRLEPGQNKESPAWGSSNNYQPEPQVGVTTLSLQPVPVENTLARKNRFFVTMSLLELGDRKSSWHPVGTYRIYLGAQHRYHGVKNQIELFPLWVYLGELAPEFLNSENGWKFYDRKPVCHQGMRTLPPEVLRFVRQLLGLPLEPETAQPSLRKKKSAAEQVKNFPQLPVATPQSEFPHAELPDVAVASSAYEPGEEGLLVGLLRWIKKKVRR